MVIFNQGSSARSDTPSYHAIPTWGNINTKTNTQTAPDDVKVGLTWGLTSYCVNNQPHPLAEQLLQNTLAGLEHMYVHTFHSLVNKHPIKLKFIW
jgi:hypothetical protein